MPQDGSTQGWRIPFMKGIRLLAECRQSLSSTRREFRFCNEIKVSDKVEFLSSGRLVGKIWKVYKINEMRVLCERNKGVHKID